MTFIKTIKAPARSLRVKLHNYLRGFDNGRPLSRTHASDLAAPGGVCPRMYALSRELNLEPQGRFLTASDEFTYEIGRMVQNRIVDYFADMGAAVGDWKCNSCGTTHLFQTRPKACSCGCKSFKAYEMRFTSAVNGASAGIDLLINQGDTRLRAVEIKSIDKDEFKLLIAPKPEHRIRTNLYLRIIAESDDPRSNLINTDTAIVFYASKGGKGSLAPDLKEMGVNDRLSPFKEFEIKRDDEGTEHLTDRALVIHAYRNGQIGMPSGVCAHSQEKRAQSCHCVSPCFSGSYPVEFDWQD